MILGGVALEARGIYRDQCRSFSARDQSDGHSIGLSLICREMNKNIDTIFRKLHPHAGCILLSTLANITLPSHDDSFAKSWVIHLPTLAQLRVRKNRPREYNYSSL